MKEIAEVMRRLYERGLISAAGGNVSCRVQHNRMWITPSGAYKGGLRASDMVKMDFDGNIIRGGRPSKEWMMHAEVYKRRDDVGAIVHSHNPITVGVASAGKLKLVTVECALLSRGIAMIPPAPPGTEKLARLVGERIGRCNAAVLQNHGILALGRNLIEAESLAESLEDNCRVILSSSLLGRCAKEVSRNLIKHLL